MPTKRVKWSATSQRRSSARSHRRKRAQARRTPPATARSIRRAQPAASGGASLRRRPWLLARARPGTTGARRRRSAVRRRSLRPSAHGRQYFLAEEAYGTDRIDGEADREHEATHAGGLGRPHLRQALVRGTADGEAAAEVVEQAELGDQRGVGLAGARAVAATQLLKRRAVLGGDAAPGEVAAAHDVGRDEREDRPDLAT